uniref:ubiquitinyl hydrolase 1 n=1 Tax=Noctiluca scintillans TaxID=2966 RepID=A0A7S0ZXJ5_NOCSC|mmetsp:Transcript_2325/g.6709  ORF Transcript_2325/g.6709 Transcript_2325/m.6709 type:complete len:305 (+) Transcript_2325:47-961(+)
MIPTISGKVGLLQNMDSLEAQYRGSTQHRQKVGELARDFGGWRRCRGDGSCFYRACGFSLIEALLHRRPKDLRPVLERVRADAAGAASGLLEFATPLCDLSPTEALELWYHRILTDPRLDADVVRAMRMVSASFLTRNREADFNGLPLHVYVEASHGLSLEAFRDHEVLPDGVEAESVALMLAPLAFDLKFEIIQLDSSDSAAQRYMVPEGPGEALATLLFKPGHYDIIYRKDTALALLAFQDRWDLEKRCTRTPTCPICMQDTDAAPLACGCIYCEDCLKSYRGSGAVTCAVCHMQFFDMAEC